MIRVSNLGFSHSPGVPALRAVDLKIRPGERLAIVGANGSGKTTLARCLNGLHLPEEGEVWVDQFSTRDPEALFDIRRRVGMVFQNPDDQLVSTTVETEIAFGLENLAVPHAEMRERVDAALRAFHLESYRHHPPHRLSGGEKQRVAIAAAVALRPDYLVLDEPTALLDPQSRREVGTLLRDLRDQFDITTIHITQLPEEAARAERILVMHRGRLLYDAPSDELLADPQRLQKLGLDLPFTCSLRHRLHRLHFPLVESLPVHPDAESLATAVLPACSPARPVSRKILEPPVGSSVKLSTRKLGHVYDRGLPTEHSALDDIDIDILEGGIVALIGPSGSGKTTFAQHLNGLLKPDRGSILLDARDIWDQDLTQVRRRVGLVFQFPELQLFDETVEEDVAFGPRNLGFGPREVEGLVTRALDAVGLPRAQFGPRSPLYLSGGEKRRIALAGILAMDPDVLVMDEPTAGLDPGAAKAMCDLFLRLRSQGKTLLLITHDMDIVAALATHIVVLQNGRIAIQGEARTVLSRPDFADLSGLEPPAAVRFMQALAARGAPVPTDLLTISEVEALFEAMCNPPS